MPTALHPTGPATASPVGATYNSVDRAMTITVNGTRHAVSVHEAHELAELILAATDSRTTAHPVTFARAAVLVHDGIYADEHAAVA